MPDLLESTFCAEQINIPVTFPRVLKVYAKAAIRTQPYDLLRWTSAYFRALANGKVPPVKKRLEYPNPRHPSGITPGYLKILLDQLGRAGKSLGIDALLANWHGMDLPEDVLYQILMIGRFCHRDFNVDEFLGVACGFLGNNLAETMVYVCELFTEEPEGGAAMIPLETFLDLYVFLANLHCSDEPDESSLVELVTDRCACRSTREDPSKVALPGSRRDSKGTLEGSKASSYVACTGYDGDQVGERTDPGSSGSEVVVSITADAAEDEEALGPLKSSERDDEDSEELDAYSSRIAKSRGNDNDDSQTRSSETEVETKTETRGSEMEAEGKIDGESSGSGNSGMNREETDDDSGSEIGKRIEAIENAASKEDRLVGREDWHSRTPNDRATELRSVIDDPSEDLSEDYSSEENITTDTPRHGRSVILDVPRECSEADPLADLIRRMEAAFPSPFVNPVVPGIGSRVSPDAVSAVCLWLADCAQRQAGLVGPRNVRHFLCPSLDSEAPCSAAVLEQL